jgi:hypothetical protein
VHAMLFQKKKEKRKKKNTVWFTKIITPLVPQFSLFFDQVYGIKDFSI